MKTMRTVGQISNELELGVTGRNAGGLVQVRALPLVHEINPLDVVELNVSLASNIRELQSMVADLVGRVHVLAAEQGCEVYGGSSVLEDVSQVVPRRYRTTALSDTCAQGFLDITSQQVVLGITDEAFGFELYNYLRNVNPVFVALSASSPYKVVGSCLEDVGALSRRVAQYEHLCCFFPEEMWRNMPCLSSLAEYDCCLQGVSDEVNRRYASGELDAVQVIVEQFLPFDRLEPHQLYWSIRPRPDHRTIEKGGSSLFSLELRIPDMPTTVQRVQMMNVLIVGLAYYVADHGAEGLARPFTGMYADLSIAAREGTRGMINGTRIDQFVDSLVGTAVRGLEERGFSQEATFLGEMVNRVLVEGNDAEIIQRLHPRSPEELRLYLVQRFREGEA